MSQAYVFVDNSNIFIEAKRIAGEKSNPPLPSNALYRIDFGKLLSHVLDGRELAATPKLYGSRPPPNDSVWEMIRKKGFEVKIFDRNVRNKEKGVDMQIGVDITRTCMREAKADIVLIAGDGDYVPCLEMLKEEGWRSEVWFWSNAATNLKRAADRFEALDDAVWTIGFEG